MSIPVCHHFPLATLSSLPRFLLPVELKFVLEAGDSEADVSQGSTH